MKRYDVVFPLGSACSCAQVVKAAGLRLASYPFDWLYGSDIRGRTDIVMKEFVGWLDEANMIEVEAPSWHPKAIYRNTVTDISFNHDFPKGVPLKDSFPAVKEKYDRRIVRLQKNLEAARRILLVWVQIPTTGRIPDGDLDYCLEAFRRKFPQAKVDIFAFDYAEGMPLENCEVVREEGKTVVRYDYREYGNPRYFYAVEQDKMIPFLRGIGIVDNRNAEERRRFASECKRKLYAQFGAKTWLGFFLTRSQYKLYCHLRKALRRKGVDLWRGETDHA